MTLKSDNHIHYLYRITNTVNGKIYIGQSIDTNSRWRAHRRDAAQDAPPMIISRAIKKYGNDSFEFDVIAACRTWEDANDTETELVKQYESHISTGKGYNVSYGGINAPKSEDWRQQMRNHWADPDYKNSISQSISMAHAARTPEEKLATAQLLSQLQKGYHNSPETEFKPGHQPSPETVEKIASKLRGIPRPELRGIPLSKEVRDKISKSKMGSIPWNKGTKGKGICKPNAQSFKTKASYPNDDELLAMVNANGLTHTAKRLGITAGALCIRLKNRNLKHNRPTTNPATQFKNGVNHPGAKLTPDQVLEIVKLFSTGKYTKSELGRQFSVDPMNIKKIITGQTWSHLTGIVKVK